MQINSVLIQAFRGYNEKVFFDFKESKLVVLYGPNGHGKTSLYDAIEWALTGHIHRFINSTDERNRTKFIRNLHANEDRETYVTLNLKLNSGERVKLIRRCTVKKKDASDYGKHVLEIHLLHSEEIICGENAEELLRTWLINTEWLDQVREVSTPLSLTHILGQEKLNEFIRGMKDGDRYNALSVLFGTDYFIKFKDIFQNIQRKIEETKRYKEGQIASINKDIEELKSQISKVKEKLTSDTTVNFQNELKNYSKRFNISAVDFNFDNLGQFKEEVQNNELKTKLYEQMLQNDINTLNKIKSSLNEFLINSETVKIAKRKLEKLKLHQKLSKRLIDIDDLIKKSSNYKSLENRKEQQQEELDKSLNLSLSLGNQNQELQEVIKQLKNEIDLSNYELHISKQLTEEETTYLNNLKRNILVSRVQIENVVQQKAGIVKSIEGLDISIGTLKDIDQKYQKFLSSLNDYLTQFESIESCPACGTPNITKEFLESFTLEEQLKLNSKLPDLEKRKISLKLDESNFNKELLKLNGKINDSEGKIEKFVNDLDGKLLAINAKITEEKIKQTKFIEEISSIEQSVIDFRKKCLEYNLDPNDSNIQNSLQLEKETTNKNIDSLEVNYLNIHDKIYSIQEEVKRAEEDITGFYNRFNFMKTITFLNVHDLKVGILNELVLNKLKHLNEELDKQDLKLESINKMLFILEKVTEKSVLSSLEQKLFRRETKAGILSLENNKLNDSIEIFSTLNKSTKPAIDKLNEKMIQELFATIQKIYTQINSHPIYTQLEFSKEYRHNSYKLMIYAKQEGNDIKANTPYIFSSAQVNAIALSLFLAMSFHQKWSPLKLIAIDDPIQSMDEINVVSFIDLIRVFVKKFDKQIIISTHDYTFYQMILRKFRFQDVAVIEYEGYSDNGPLLKYSSLIDGNSVRMQDKLDYNEVLNKLELLDN